MTITRTQLISKSKIASELGKHRDSSVLSDMAENLKKWGNLTSRQEDYARSLMERYSDVDIKEHRNKREKIKRDWDNKNEDFLKWVDFVTFFFISANCKRYEYHVERLRRQARIVKHSLDTHLVGAVPCPIEDISTLLDSKLIDTLRDTYTATPKYTVGDLMCLRGRTGQHFSAWTTQHGSREGRFIRESFQICIITEVVNGTFRCKNVHKTKGSSRLYRLKAFSGGQTAECLIEEDLIKPMK